MVFAFLYVRVKRAHHRYSMDTPIVKIGLSDSSIVNSISFETITLRLVDNRYTLNLTEDASTDISFELDLSSSDGGKAPKNLFTIEHMVPFKVQDLTFRIEYLDCSGEEEPLQKEVEPSVAEKQKVRFSDRLTMRFFEIPPENELRSIERRPKESCCTPGKKNPIQNNPFSRANRMMVQALQNSARNV